MTDLEDLADSLNDGDLTVEDLENLRGLWKRYGTGRCTVESWFLSPSLRADCYRAGGLDAMAVIVHGDKPAAGRML